MGQSKVRRFARFTTIELAHIQEALAEYYGGPLHVSTQEDLIREVRKEIQIRSTIKLPPPAPRKHIQPLKLESAIAYYQDHTMRETAKYMGWSYGFTQRLLTGTKGRR